MTVRTRSQLKADADSSLPDNVVGLIAPEDVRDRVKDLADSALLAEDVGDAAFKDVGTGSDDVAAGDHTHSAATTSVAGFMSSSDKLKLDGIESGAQVNAVTSVAGKTGTVTLAKEDVGLGNVSNDAQLKAASNLSDVATPATAFNNIKQSATDTATGVVELATATEIRAGSAGALAVTAAGIKDALALATPSGAANWTPDWAAFVVADWNVTANRTLSNPTNVIAGTTRYVFIRGSSGTPRTITFGSNFKGDLPTLDDVTNTKWYLLSLVAYSATHIVVAAVEASP